MRDKKYISIGGITLALDGFDPTIFHIGVPESLFFFENPKQIDLTLTLVLEPEREMVKRINPQWEKTFDSGGLYETYGCGNEKTIAVYNRAQSLKFPYTLVSYDLTAKRGVLVISEEAFGCHKAEPFAYPLSELLWIQLLASFDGFILHAFAPLNTDGVHCFAGVSGAGKSTMAWQYQRLQPQTHLLSDDRIILRRQTPGRWMAYGTPWCGDAKITSTEGGPLTAIDFIRHGEGFRASRVSMPANQIVEHLLVRSFPPFYDKKAMQHVLDLFWDIATHIPCNDHAWVRHAAA